MVASLNSDKEKARFLYQYLQKSTRYVSIQLGIGGLKPFPATFVDDKKYGDCKALTNYMHTLLKCVNIPSYYALVRAGSNEEPANPKFTNDPFNHIILCIPFENDTTWLECTSTTSTFGKLGSFTENRNALLITDNGGILVNTPKSKAQDNTFESQARINLQSDGSAAVTVKIRLSGEYQDMFSELSHRKSEEQKELFINYLNIKQPDALHISYPLTNNDLIKEVELSLDYLKLNDIATGNKYFYKPNLLDLWQTTLPTLQVRQTDYFFDHPMLKKGTTVYILPNDVEVESLPPDVSLRFQYGNYLAKYTYDKERNEINAHVQFELSHHVIPASKYHEMQKFMDDISVSMKKKLVLRKKT
jgi:hypothetical protein